MKSASALTAFTSALLFTVGASTVKADTYTYNVKAEIDFSGVNPAMLSRAGLDVRETLLLEMTIDSPQYPIAPVSSHWHTPDRVQFEIGGRSASASGGTAGGGGIFGGMVVVDQPVGAFYNDFLGFRIEPRALPGLPYRDLGRIYIKTRYTNNTFDSVKLPETNAFMANLIQTTTGYMSAPYVELWVMRNGPGTGFDYATAPIRAIDISVTVTP